MFSKEGVDATKYRSIGLICIICNKRFWVSSALSIHQQKSHSKEDLSKALIQLQNLLIQSKFIINSLKHVKETKDERQSDEEDQHFLHNCMHVNDLEALLNKEFILPSKSKKKNNSVVKDEEIYDDTDFQVSWNDFEY